MTSPYASRVADHGRGWQRPWLVFLSTTFVCGVLRWLTSTEYVEQVICTPEPKSRWQAAVNVGELSWTGDLNAALQCGHENGRDVLIAFHAVCDANANMNEREFARNQNLRSALKRRVLVMLHTDVVPVEFYKTPDLETQRRDGLANLAFELKTLHTEQEPLYVIVRPTGQGKFVIAGRYDESRINDAGAFAHFLRDPRNYRLPGFWESIRMRLRNLISALLAVIPLLFSGCNRGENGGGGGIFGGRTPTLQFVKEGESGCADVFLYKTTADQREYLLVNADKDKLKLRVLESKVIDLAGAPDGVSVKIELWSCAPRYVPYCNCVRDDSKLEATWTAKSGKVTITLHDFVQMENDPMRRYKVSAKLENVLFQDDAGRKTTLKEATITEVVVGWYAG